MQAVTSLHSYRPYWAKRFGTAPILPMTRAEMDELGWDSCDVILVTGDAYIDHPSFGMALVGRLLEAQGFRVGIIAQPDWQSADAFKVLGKPNLYFGITAGNMDSMVNRYTAERKIRSDDAYTPEGVAGKRPDRAILVYSQRCREAYSDVPLVIGSIEASLRRIAHYDYWSDKVRRSVLIDSKADILLYGNAERALVELTHRLAKGEAIHDITDLRGTAILRKEIPEGWLEVASTQMDKPGRMDALPDPYAMEAAASCSTAATSAADASNSGDSQPIVIHRPAKVPRERQVVRLPDYELVSVNSVMYAHASRVLHLEANPGNARALVQRHGDREVWLNPPPIPLTTKEMDYVYDLTYARAPHPAYGKVKIPAWEMIRFSVNIMRGCFGGCTFCSITEHEGRIIQSRSEESILKEVEEIRDKVEGFTGVISDLGGPTANMYRIACKSEKIESACRKLSCVYPGICENLNTDHSSLIQIYRKARALPGIKKVLVSSGLRYDLAVKSPEYVKELVQHHVGGYLKIAPEHSEENVL
ncbi:MAG TPA: YgiQ family radical SAM protein, partial [Methylophilaceae bacterium]